MMRIIIDTNLWISALLGQKMRDRISVILSNTEISILGHQEILDEIAEVITRPKLAKYISEKIVSEMLDIMKDRLDFVEYHSKLDLCRDEADNYLLALALDNKANYLLTGDKDLLVLNPVDKLGIISLSDFEKLV